MKKKYSSKLAWMGATLCAFLLVACGLKISNVTLSTHELEANGEVTISTTFTNPDDDTNSGWGDNTGNYLLYAVRVPADWTAADVLSAVSNVDGTYEFVESKPYATLAEYCFPKDGYKWIAFQTSKPSDVNIKNVDGDEIVSTLTLKAGEKAGDYKLDVISGAVEADPAELLNADGTLNLDKAFGLKRNLSDVNDLKTFEGQDVYALSLYLVCTTTFSAEELNAYGRLRLSNTITHNVKTDDGFGNNIEVEKTLPICATADIQNNLSAEELADLDLNVKVKGVQTGVSEIESERKDNAPVYNLQGVKVADTTAPGIYIKNGKKFIVK